MVKAGDLFMSGRTGGVVGAVVPWGNGFAGVAPAHVFRYSGTVSLTVCGFKTSVIYVPGDADLAYFPVGAKEATHMAKPTYGEASLVNAMRTMDCRITDVSWSVAFVMLQQRNMPGPGDSGTPVIQDGRVVGMLLTINLGTCKGVIISSDLMRRGRG
jgi:hypothetical protein